MREINTFANCKMVMSLRNEILCITVLLSFTFLCIALASYSVSTKEEELRWDTDLHLVQQSGYFDWTYHRVLQVL